MRIATITLGLTASLIGGCLPGCTGWNTNRTLPYATASELAWHDGAVEEWLGALEQHPDAEIEPLYLDRYDAIMHVDGPCPWSEPMVFGGVGVTYKHYHRRPRKLDGPGDTVAARRAGNVEPLTTPVEIKEIWPGSSRYRTR